jgi:ribonuclease Y
MRKLEISGNEKLEQRANDILVTAVHRLGNSVVGDVLATTVQLPNDEIKGKIIGKEGRNIRAFERATGVDVIVDDTPGTITLSSYDPVTPPDRAHRARKSDHRRSHPAGKNRRSR